jgi:hypothetical protein
MRAQQSGGLTALKWIGTAAGITGAILLSLNIEVSGWGFVAFLINTTFWMAAGLILRDRSLWSMNLVFTVTNLVGIYRWLIA